MPATQEHIDAQTPRLAFSGRGFWVEVFNSDVYDNWVNPIVAGNGSGVNASGGRMHGLPCSASIEIPANGLRRLRPRQQLNRARHAGPR